MTSTLAAPAALINPAAGVIVGVVGSIVDNAFLFPFLFGEETKPPSLGAVDANFAEEGAPVQYCMGSTCRIAGQVLYVSDPFFSATPGSSKRGEPANVTWWADVVIGICDNEIKKIKKWFFDGELIYLRDPAFSTLETNGGTINVYLDAGTGQTIQRWIWDPGYMSGMGAWHLADWHLTVLSRPAGPGAPDIAKFTVGQPIDIENQDTLESQTGLEVLESRVVNNQGDTRLVVDLRSYWNAFGNWSWSRGQNVGMPLTPPTVAPANYPWNINPLGNPPWEFDQTGQRWKPNSLDPNNTEIWLGTDIDQTSALLQARVGTANAPGRPGFSYVAIKDMNLSSFGNRVAQVTFFPNTVSTTEGVELTLANAVSDLLTNYAGFTAGELDVTGLSGDMRGIVFTGAETIRTVLAHMAMANDIRTTEDAGVIKFFHAQNRTTRTLLEEDLDARPFGDEPRPALDRFHDEPNRNMEDRIHVRYVDVDKDNQWGDEFDVRDNLSAHARKVTRQLQSPVTMSASEAKAMARRVLRDSHEERQSTTLRLPPKYLDLEPDDVLVVTYGGETWNLLVRTVDVLGDFTVACEVVVLTADNPPAPSGLDNTRPGVSDDLGNEHRGLVPRGLTPIFLEVIDVTAFSDTDNMTTGVYLAAAPFSRPAGLDPIEAWRADAFDSDSYYKYADLKQSVMGFVISAAPLGSANPGVMDHGNTIRVKLLGGQLTSVSEKEAWEGKTLCVIGNEVLAFTTATLVDTLTYDLSGLVRGMLGTEQEIGKHYAANERFVLIDGKQTFCPVNVSDVGQNAAYKAIALGDSLSVATRRALPTNGNSALSLPPVGVRTFLDHAAANDVIFEFCRQSRARSRLFGETEVPLPEVVQEFDIVIDPDGVNRTKSIIVDSGTPTWTYTAAMRSTDGLSGKGFAADIYQKDRVRGRGRPVRVHVGGQVLEFDDDPAGSGNALFHTEHGKLETLRQDG